MNNSVQDILKDLYELDPSLRAREAELVSVISELIAAKPNAVLDPDFARTLRSRLENRAEMPSQPFARGWWKLLAPAFAGGLVVAAVMLGAARLNTNKISPTGEMQLFSSQPAIEDAGAQAFGRLPEYTASGARGMGGGGGPTAAEGIAKDIRLYQPIRYVYRGDPLKLSEGKLDVYRKEKGSLSGADASGWLKQLNMGLLDTGGFQNVSFGQITFSEDREYGYSFIFDLAEGSVYINQNWERWPDPARDCQDEACILQFQLRPEQVPADDAVLAVANDFLKAYSIDTSSYGQPQVRGSWKGYIDASGLPVTPEILQVVYPFSLGGETVYDQSGAPSGLEVSVNLRLMKAIGVSGLESRRYQKSAYDGETDVSRLMEYLNRYSQSGETQEVGLGTPVRAYAVAWQTEGGKSVQLAVPALIFPVLDESFGPSSVVVPLIREMIAAQPEPPVRIMPADSLQQ